MNPSRLDLARHALGLPNRNRVTYRNRFVTPSGNPQHALWMEMVDEGLAVRVDGKRLPFGGDDLFCLTPAGANQALAKGEQLDPEDFPEALSL